MKVTQQDLEEAALEIIKERIEEMLDRPEMHAQNPASLEDQFTLLLGFIDERLIRQYTDFCWFKRTGTSSQFSKTGPGAPHSMVCSGFGDMAEHLREFFEEHC